MTVNSVASQANNETGEIDLNQAFASFARNKFLLLAGSGLGFLAAILVNQLTPKIWQGEFQIVLSRKERLGGNAGGLGAIANNPLLAQIAGIGGGAGGSELETEVKILESPLVLKPIFEYVKSVKSSMGKPVETLRFSGWAKQNLRVKLEKGTAILNISYKDNDKSLVLAVLDRISHAYQSYSGRDRTESLRRGLNYISSQASIFRQRAAESNRALDSFSIRYGISNKGASTSGAGIDVNKLLGAGSSGQQDGGALLNLSGGTSSGNVNISNQGDALSQLAAINQELIRRQQLLTDRDPSIAALMRERNAMRRYIESTAGGNLALPGQKPLRKEQAQEIMLRYQELERTAKRDTAILDSLERSLMSLQLETARSPRPWELISSPTLLDRPVSPKPLRNIAIGLLAGLSLGCYAALLKDKRSGMVFSIDEILKSLPYPVLATIDIENVSQLETCTTLIAEGTLAGVQKTALIPVGLINQTIELKTSLLKALKKLNADAELMLTTDLAEAKCCNSQLLLVRPGAVNREALSQLQQNLQLQGKPVTGLLILSDAG